MSTRRDSSRWRSRCCLAAGDAAATTDDNGPVDPPRTRDLSLHVAAGGDNVPDRYSSDLWVHGDYAYTGTWGCARTGTPATR